MGWIEGSETPDGAKDFGAVTQQLGPKMPKMRKLTAGQGAVFVSLGGSQRPAPAGHR